MNQRNQIYIGGSWVDSCGDDAIDVYDPSTGSVIGSVPAGTPADVAACLLYTSDAADE